MTQFDLNSLSNEEIWCLMKDIDERSRDIPTPMYKFIGHEGWGDWAKKNPGRSQVFAKLRVTIYPGDVFIQNIDEPCGCVFIAYETKEVEKSFRKIMSKRRRSKIDKILE